MRFRKFYLVFYEKSLEVFLHSLLTMKQRIIEQRARLVQQDHSRLEIRVPVTDPLEGFFDPRFPILHTADAPRA